MLSFNTFLTEESKRYNLYASYDEYNAKYFNNELPKINLTYKNLKAHGNCISFMNRTTKVERVDSINISTRYHMTYEEFRDVLVHEMIHAYLAHSQQREREHHGFLFMSMMDALNKKHPELHLVKNAERSDVAIENKNDTNVIFVVFPHDSKYVIVVTSKKMMDDSLKATMRRYFTYSKDIYQFLSKDKDLLKYTKPRSAKTQKYYISSKEYFETIKSSSLLVRHIPDIFKAMEENDGIN